MIIQTDFEDTMHLLRQGRANRTGNLKTIKRIVNRAPEVMVKITSFGKGTSHVKGHLEYIARNGDVDLENERGEVFSGKDEVKSIFKDWQAEMNADKSHKNKRHTLHMVLSMPESVESEAVRSAVRAFAKTNFGSNHEYVFALHTDEPHPHCHLAVKMQGFDGKRLNPRKADLKTWRESFAEKMREQGVEAEATPRATRGVVKKAEKAVIRHIERGDKNHPPRIPKVKALKVKEAVTEISAIQNNQIVELKPWESKVLETQKRIRSAWANFAAQLDQSPLPEQKMLSKRVVEFVSTMPKVETERTQIKKQLLERLHNKSIEQLDKLPHQSKDLDR
jgi:type IV secretory pathway VirD2 relaxase